MTDNNSLFVRRPNTKENENDLLRQQNEYEKNECNASCNVKQYKRKSGSKVNIEKKVKYSSVEQFIDDEDKHLSVLLTQINEKDVVDSFVAPVKNVFNSTGMPLAVKITPCNSTPVAVEIPNVKKAKKSIFAQQLEKHGHDKMGIHHISLSTSQAYADEETVAKFEFADMHQGSLLITGNSLAAGQFEAQRIHEENLHKMRSMPESEILKEKERLEISMDPKMLAFIATLKSSASSSQRLKDNVNDVGGMGNAQAVKNSSHTKMSRHSETEKVAWMQEVSTPENVQVNDLPARFDLEGLPVEPLADIPMHLGLHHHGSEAHRAGYTPEELFILARSAAPAQRVLALTTLGRLCRASRSGKHLNATQKPLLQPLLDAGLLFLLRIALDDSNAAVWQAALGALHGLLVRGEEEEMALMHTELWCVGAASVAFVSRGALCQQTASRITRENEGEVESDADVAKYDCVLALLRMDILARFHYFLQHDMCAFFPPLSATHLINLLTYMARHSRESAFKLAEYRAGALLTKLITHFLPLHCTCFEEPVRVGAVPFPEMLRLLHVLCQSSRGIAQRLSGCIFDRCLVYLSQEVVSLSPSFMAQRLRSEALRALSTLAAYGLGAEQFAAELPILVQSWRSTAHLPAESAHFMHLMSYLLCTFASTCHGELVWHMVEPLALNALNNVEEWAEFAAASRCLTVYLSKNQQDKRIRAYVMRVLRQALRSESLGRLVRRLRPHLLLTQKATIEVLSPECALDAGHEVFLRGQDDQVVPMRPTQDDPALAILLSLLQLTETIQSSELILLWLTQSDLFQLTRHLINNWPEQLDGLLHCWFLRFELEWLSRVAILSSSKLLLCEQIDCNRDAWARLALRLLPTLRVAQDYLAMELMTNVIMSPEVLRVEFLLSQMKALDVNHEPKMDKCDEQVRDVAHDIQSHLTSVKMTYKRAFIAFQGGQAALSQNQYRYEHFSLSSISNWQVRCSNDCAIPADWAYLPILLAYGECEQQQQQLQQQQTQQRWNSTDAVNSLRWVYCQEVCFKVLLSPACHFARLISALLIDDHIFLDPAARRFFTLLIARLGRQAQVLDQLQLDKPMPGLTSFYDLYVDLLLHFSATSFGDALFANVLLIATQQRHHVHFRRALWGEHLSALRVIRLRASELLMSLDEWLHPRETDPNMIFLYAEALLSEVVSESRSPLLYLLAVHHVNAFLYDQSCGALLEEVNMRQALWHRLKQQPSCPLRSQLILYRTCDSQGSALYYETLPSIRKSLIDNYGLQTL